MREIEHSFVLCSNWKRFVPEIAVLLLALLALDQFAFAGDRFATVNPHPFWIVVLLAAAQYGVIAGVLATTASSIALYAGALPPREAGMDLYDYAALVTWQPALWWAAAATLGGLRALHIHNAAQTKAKLVDTVEQAQTIAIGFKRASRKSIDWRLASSLAPARLTACFTAWRTLTCGIPALMPRH